jgi:hypothetical protein
MELPWLWIRVDADLAKRFIECIIAPEKIYEVKK